MFSNSGQLCISVERLLVHESIEQQFLASLVKRVKAMRLGAGLNYDYDMGSLISEEQLETVRVKTSLIAASGSMLWRAIDEMWE